MSTTFADSWKGRLTERRVNAVYRELGRAYDAIGNSVYRVAADNLKHGSTEGAGIGSLEAAQEAAACAMLMRLDLDSLAIEELRKLALARGGREPHYEVTRVDGWSAPVFTAVVTVHDVPEATSPMPTQGPRAEGSAATSELAKQNAAASMLARIRKPRLENAASRPGVEV